MIIPKTFRLFGLDFTVKFVEGLRDRQGTPVVGKADHMNNLVQIAASGGEFELHRQQQEVAFLHELLHHILLCLGEDELSDREPFVDNVAQLLHQFLTTQKGKQ